MKNASLLLFAILFLLACSKKQLNKKKNLTNLFYDKAFEYREQNKADSAFKYFNKAREVFLSQNDSLGVAKCLANMGNISFTKSDYFGAQDYSLQALKYFKTKIDSQFKYINTNYHNLGRASYQIRDYPNSLKFYDLAIKFSRNSLHTSIYLNSKGKTYQEIKDYDKALKTYEQALKGLGHNSEEYARTLTNIALAKWLKDINYNPVSEYLIALHIREKQNDLWGQNSSYVHLAEFYARDKPATALGYAKKAYKVAKILKSPSDQLSALQLLVSLSGPAAIKNYFEVYKTLNDSIQAVLNADKNQFAIIRYDFEKGRAENFELQKDNTEKKYQIIKREIMLYGSFLLIILILIFAILWYKKRKQKLELQAQNTIQESKLKTSKKIHDVVANGLYRVMTEIENQEGMDKEEMLDRLDLMYQKSRDISYEGEEIKLNHQNFKNKISDLLNSFNTKHTTITINGNADKLWAKVNHQAQYEIEHILQELMVNMKKHSQATQVDIVFKQIDNQILINYTDNGIGIVGQPQYGNGLSSTGNRIKNMEGKITFDTKLERGLKVLIAFPIA